MGNKNTDIEYNIKYKVGNNEEITIFGKNFVEKNKNICKIIYEGKEYLLTEKFNIKNQKEKIDILEIKLKRVNKIKDISDMFCECSNLICLPDISNINTCKFIDISNIFSGCVLLA